MKVAFMFPGQGSLEEGMGREIVEAVPEARQVFREGSEAAGIDLEKLCFDTPMSELVETENQQPALVATCLAINEAIRVRGIKPDFVVGHSVGEFAALAAARSLTAAEAIGLVRERGLLVLRLDEFRHRRVEAELLEVDAGGCASVAEHLPCLGHCLDDLAAHALLERALSRKHEGDLRHVSRSIP